MKSPADAGFFVCGGLDPAHSLFDGLVDADEGTLYDDLRDNRIRSNLRLEQERIAFSWVEDVLSNIS